jgi:putative drug exporter of the RND superfamily
MSRLLYRVGRFCAIHRARVAATWLAAVAAVAIAAIAVGSQTSDNLNLPGTDSTTATDLLEQKLPTKANGTVPIVLESSKGRLDSGANKNAVNETVKSLKRNENVQAAVSPLSDKGSGASPTSRSPWTKARATSTSTRLTR